MNKHRPRRREPGRGAGKRIATLFLVLLTVLGLSACDTYDNFMKEFFIEYEEAEKVVKIGIYEPLSGSDAEGAADEIAGIELAHELYGTVLGLKVELVYSDNKSDVKEGAAAAQSLVDQGVTVVLGSYKSTLSLAASDVFKENKVPAIGITCTNPLITQTNKYYSRVCFVDAFQGIYAAKYVVEYLEKDGAVAIKMEGDDLASAMIEQFAGKMDRALDSEDSVKILEYSKDTTDFTQFFKRIEATGYDTVFFPSSPSAGEEVIWQAKEGGYGHWNWLGGSSWEDMRDVNTVSVREDKSHLEGVAYVTDFNANSEMSEMSTVFLDAYRDKYGEDEQPEEAVALGFDAYMLAIEAIRQAGTLEDSLNIANQLSKIFEFPGATGYITLNADGDPIKNVVIEQIKNGEYIPIYTAVPVWGE